MRYIFFLFLEKKKKKKKKKKNCYGYSEAPHRGTSNEYQQHMLSLSNKKICNFEKVNLASRKKRLYKFDPLKPHFNTVKLGFQGLYIIFLISAQKPCL